MPGVARSACAVYSACSQLLSRKHQEVDERLYRHAPRFQAHRPGLRALRHGPDGKYYLLASPSVGMVVFDAKGQQLSVIGAPPAAPVANKAGRSAIAFGEDCDVDAQGNIYVADRGYNLVTVFSPDGKLLRSVPCQLRHFPSSRCPKAKWPSPPRAELHWSPSTAQRQASFAILVSRKNFPRDRT